MRLRLRHLSATLPAFLGLAAALPAQSQVEVPGDGSVFRLAPQTVHAPFLLQQIVSGERLPAQAMIRDLGLRVFTYTYQCGYETHAYPFPYGGRVLQVEVRAGHTGKNTRTMTTELASNRTGAMQQVFAGKVQLPVLAGRETGKAFQIVFQKPFFYDRSRGDLLIEIQSKTTLSPGQPSFVTSGLELTFMQPLGVFQPRGTGGKLKGFGSPFSISGASVNLNAGTGGAELLVTAPSSYPPVPSQKNWFVLGTKPDTLSLQPFGAPGNTLYLQPLVILPASFRFMNCTTLQHGIRRPLPLAPGSGLVQSGLIVQAITESPGDNEAGLVFSNAMDVTLTSLENGGTQAVVAYGPNATVGSFLDPREGTKAGSFAGLTMELGLQEIGSRGSLATRPFPAGK